MWDDLLKPLQSYRPHRLFEGGGLPQAAVLLPITGTESPELILTLRASGLSTHGGQVAFPGGRREPQDADLAATALRETWEEIGLAPESVELAGRLSTLISLHQLEVTPFVGRLSGPVKLRPNDAEIAEVFSVPLSFFLERPPECVHRLPYRNRHWYVPSYRYRDYQIWGLSAIMIAELLNVLFDAGIDLNNPPENFVALR